MDRPYERNERRKIMAYERNGIEYPSVTTILGMLDKPALLGWASNCAVDYIAENMEAIKDPLDVHRGEQVLEQARKAYATKRDDAACFGTQAHHAIEAYINGIDPEEYLKAEQSRNAFMAFKSWEEKNHVEWLETECEVVSETHGYAGRFDAIARINGHKYLVDFKTSKGIYDEMKYQISAYLQAYNEQLQEGQERLKNIAILHLDKETGEPTFKPIEKDIGRMIDCFNYLVMVYYLQKNRRLKNNPFVARIKGEKETGLPF
jgi:hypothetical protein